MLTKAGIMAVVIGIPVFFGAQLIGTQSQAEGYVMIFIGLLLSVFFVAALSSLPSSGSGWSSPTPD